MEILCGDVRSPDQLSACAGPVAEGLLHRPDIADQPDHDLGFGEPGDDVGLRAGSQYADVVGRLAEHGIDRKHERAQLGEHIEQRFQRAAAQMGIRRMRLAPADPHDHPLGAFAARGELAFGRLTVHQKFAGGGEAIRRERAR